jgi:PncC family amidohydrolase
MDSSSFEAWFAMDAAGIAGRLVTALRTRGLTVSFAESCTGGKLAAAVTAVPGASAVFELGVVTYSDQAKHAVLGVPEELLNEHGAVSAECVRAMSLGIQSLAGSDASVAVSGIAGPDGGSEHKPVGTVWIGVACAKSLGESVRKRVSAEARPSGRIASPTEIPAPRTDVELAAVCIHFDGGRESVRDQAVRAAMALLLVAIGEQP